MHKFLTLFHDLLKRKANTAGFLIIAVEEHPEDGTLKIEVVHHNATALTYLGAIRETIERLHAMKRENTTGALRDTFKELFLSD